MTVLNYLRRQPCLNITHNVYKKTKTVASVASASSKATTATTASKNNTTLHQYHYASSLRKVQEEKNHVQQLITSIQSTFTFRHKKQYPFVKHDVHVDVATTTTVPPSIPTVGNVNIPSVPVGYQVMNRNARKPKKANHGARPCSRISRRAKRSKYGNPRRK